MKKTKYQLDEEAKKKGYLNFADYVIDNYKTYIDTEGCNLGLANLYIFSNMVLKADRKEFLLDLHYLSRRGEWRLSETDRDIINYNIVADDCFVWFFKHWWI